MNDYSNIKESWKVFCRELIIDWNQSRAYKVAYPNATDATARTNSSKLLTNANIKSYIKHLQSNLQKVSGITMLRNALELKKIAYSNVSELKKDWEKFKDFESLDDDVKAAISEITHSKTQFDGGEKSVVKVKMHDKLKAIQELNKMFGFEAKDKNSNMNDFKFKITFE